MALSFYESQLRMIPGVHVPTRSVLVKTRSGSVLISPIDFTAEQIDAILSQGEVVAIVEPNVFHNTFAQRAKQAFPRATLWGVPGIEVRNPKIAWEKKLTEDPVTGRHQVE